MNEREQAFNILQRVEKEEAFAAPLLDSVSADDRDRRFVRNVVLGVLRWRNQIDAVIERLAQRKINALDAITRQVLRIGVYQLMFTDVPPHAAVNEGVDLVGRRNARARGVVNAVLRKASSTDLRGLLPKGATTHDAAVQLGHPQWLLQRWEQQYGVQAARDIAAANQRLSFADLMINTNRVAIDAAHERLRQLGVAFTPSPHLEHFVRLESSSRDAQPLIEEGLVYAMDEGSAIVASLVSPQSRSVLDVTAAPGGKSLVLALRGQRVLSNDVSLSRLVALRESARRLSLPAALLISDATRPPLRRRFDSVLLDAPCSATGTIRRNPELKWRVREETIREMASLQKTLLHAALDQANEECVYSTCSLEREENEEVVQSVLRERDDFHLVSFSNLQRIVRVVGDGAVVHLLPSEGTDGFTIHRLLRKAH